MGGEPFDVCYCGTNGNLGAGFPTRSGLPLLWTYRYGDCCNTGYSVPILLDIDLHYNGSNSKAAA